MQRHRWGLHDSATAKQSAAQLSNGIDGKGMTQQSNGEAVKSESQRRRSMELITVGTGSTGNCYLLHRDNDTYIALDCGCPWKKVQIATKFSPTKILFALVTHSHGDHNGYARDFEKNCISVFSPGNIEERRIKSIGGVDVVPFEVPHDVQCFAYLIRVDGRNIVYMTDFGYCKYTLKSWNIGTFVIACNYIDLPDTSEAKYSHVVRGHSSLKTVKDILEVNKTDALRNVILCHISGGQDTERMKSEIQEVVGDSVNVTIATKGAVINL